jgi:hypothetical protein
MFLEYFLAEFHHEMQTTRALLARGPDASAGWRPHPKSTPVGTLAQHITNLVGFGTPIAEGSERDVAPVGGPPPAPVPRAAVLRTYLLNHLIHHRGQLSVHLRLLDVPLPSISGPTADDAR